MKSTLSFENSFAEMGFWWRSHRIGQRRSGAGSTVVDPREKGRTRSSFIKGGSEFMK